MYRVYEYGAITPTGGEDVAVDQMRRRVMFWNMLVEIERDHNLRVESVIAELSPGTEAAARPGKDADNDLRVAYRSLRREAFRRDDIKQRLSSLEDDRIAAVKRATSESGLWWCNYDSVLTAYKLARKKPGDLRFHSWRGARGKISVRYQTGLAVADATGDDTRFRLRIVPPPDERAATAKRCRDYTRAIASVRVGSSGRAPVWLELPIRLHRPLPKNGTIRQVEVTRESIGSRYRWRILIVVDEQVEARTASGPTIAVNVGWRVRSDGLRVAFWRSTNGESGELVLPDRWLRQMAKVDDIQSIRDNGFNAMRDRLREWIKSVDVLPEWLRESTATIAQWRSIGRLASVVIRWRTDRLDGDDEMFSALEAWRSRDKHLWEYQANMRDQLLRERREIYRIFAAQIARTHGVLRMHTFDLRPMAQRGEEGQADEFTDSVRLNRSRAAISVLRITLQQACSREGVEIVTTPKFEPITRTCSSCGADEPFDAAADLNHTCRRCGSTYDQDDNACRNILDWQPQVVEQAV